MAIAGGLGALGSQDVTKGGASGDKVLEVGLILEQQQEKQQL